MAHLIDNSKGFNAFVSFAAPAWHGLGRFNFRLTCGAGWIFSKTKRNTVITALNIV